MDNANSKRFWNRMAIILGLPILGLVLYAQWPDEYTPDFQINLLVLVLKTLVFVVLCILAFLISRNVVKLIFDRRRNILGSHLRLRLVLAFVGLTLIPSALLFVLASGLLNRAMSDWFSPQVEASVSGAVEVARQHYATIEKLTLVSARSLGHEVEQNAERFSDQEMAKVFLEEQRKAHSFYGVQIYREPENFWVEVHNAAAAVATFKEPVADKTAIKKGLLGDGSVLLEETESGQFVRAYLPLRIGELPAVMLATNRINSELSQALKTVNDSFREYEQLKLYKTPLRSSYILILTMLTGLILFAAIWFGFYLARQLVVPIQKLAQGTEAVAKGNYDFRLEVAGDDEIALLVRSFNKMTEDLKQSTSVAERRRLFLESVLGNLAVGVIGLDSNGTVTSINSSAAKLFGQLNTDGLVNQHVSKVIPSEDFAQVSGLIAEIQRPESIQDSPVASREKELLIQRFGRELRVVCTAGLIVESGGRHLGTLLLFDDITELVKAQHIAAWREVARRIAHEIKNPLTPIQLSAQRLEKLLLSSPASEAVKESVQTIVEHVDSIKRLANEFSNFARMPDAELKPADLNAIVSDAILPYAEENSEIVFQFIADNKIPEIYLDRDQIRRLLINLIENSVFAIKNSREALGGDTPRIVLKTSYNRGARNATLEVVDNGPGVRHTDKTRIFEPYFTTRKGGTGLGLAIVTSIVADHQGEIRVYDNQPHGAKFVVELPLQPAKGTQRKLAAI